MKFFLLKKSSNDYRIYNGNYDLNCPSCKVETLYWFISKKGKPINISQPIIFCKMHGIYDFQKNFVLDKRKQINEILNYNSGVIKSRISNFRAFVYTILFKYQEMTKKLYESATKNSSDKNYLREERMTLKLYYGYSLLRLFELEDDKGLFFERGEKLLKTMNENEYKFFWDVMESELNLLLNNKFDLLSIFDYGEKNNKLAIIFNSDKRILKKILRWGSRNENRAFFNSINDLQLDFIFYDRDQSSRHFSLERMEDLWDLYLAIYKEFFGIDCLFENPTEFKHAVETFRLFHTEIIPLGKENLNSSINYFAKEFNISQEQLKKYVDSFLPICYDLENMIPIRKCKTTYNLEKSILNAASCWRIKNDKFFIPQPLDWLERRLEDIGPLFLKKIETLPGKINYDLFCDEIEILINGILARKISINPTLLHKGLSIQPNFTNLKIIAKNKPFTLDSGEEGEIDLIIQNMGIVYLLEAKSLRKGRANRKYIRNTSPRQCDRYVDLIKSGAFKSLLSKFQVDYDQIKEVRILIVTSRNPDFHFVQSKDTKYVFGVISVVDFLRLYIGFRSNVESSFVDDLGREIGKILQNGNKDVFTIQTSILQTKHRLNAYKQQIDTIYTYNWLNSRNLIHSMPEFSFPKAIKKKDESNEELMSFFPFSKGTGEFLFGTFNQLILEGSFKNEPSWILKTPKEITERPIKVYLATQIGNNHYKAWCESCEICYVYYESGKQLNHEMEKKCYFCEEKLIDFPSALRKKYSTELTIKILHFKMEIQSKMLRGCINYE